MNKIVLNIISAAFVSSFGCVNAQKDRPNILFIMSDDHATQAISCYGKEPLRNVISTPNIDRIAAEGIRLDNCFVTNSISTPSRAAIITGQYSQLNGVYTLADEIDPNLPTMIKEFGESGYQTAIVGKWHLQTEPSYFDYYNVLPGLGRYHNPILKEKENLTGENFKQATGTVHQGHSTDIITDEAIRWLTKTDSQKPFLLLCHFRAPHREWEPAERFKSLYEDIVIPEPENLYDNYAGKGESVKNLRLMLEHMNKADLKTDIPQGMSVNEFRRWAYQIYIKDYLRCVAGVDENVGRLLKYLEDNHLLDNTVIVYTADQGFFLGEHGFFDKRLMYEESLRMPCMIRYPKKIKSGQVNKDIVLNIDFAPTLLDFAGIKTPKYMQGKSFLPNLQRKTPVNWRKNMYYRYWLNADRAHNVTAHYGIRDNRYKLIFYYGQALGMSNARTSNTTPEWEFYDLQSDPMEMNNQYNNPDYKEIIRKMKLELIKIKKQYKDEDSKYPEMKDIINRYYW